MFNEIRLFEGQPVRLWSQAGEGRYVIFPNGIMRWLKNEVIGALPRALFNVVPRAFPEQDQGDRM